MRPWSVVIPSNSYERLNAVIGRIHEMEAELSSDRIIVIDDSVSPIFPVQDWCDNLEFLEGHKPFIFARNMNLGLAECARRGHDAILLNDDALLETPGGFTMLAEAMYSEAAEGIGILSPTCNSIGNPNQYPRHKLSKVLPEARMLCFVCVYIRLEVFTGPNAVLFDERYVDYGMDDDDYCKQAMAAGWKLGVLESVVIDHKTLSSAYRGKGAGDFRPNLRRFIEKWGVDNWGRTKDKSEFPECFPA